MVIKHFLSLKFYLSLRLALPQFGPKFFVLISVKNWACDDVVGFDVGVDVGALTRARSQSPLIIRWGKPEPLFLRRDGGSNLDPARAKFYFFTLKGFIFQVLIIFSLFFKSSLSHFVTLAASKKKIEFAAPALSRTFSLNPPFSIYIFFKLSNLRSFF